MSFSSEVKDELSRQISMGRHCRLAEIAAIISCCGKIIQYPNNKVNLKVQTENVSVARKYFTLIKKTFNIDTELSVKRNVYLKKARTYSLVIKNHDDCMQVLAATKLWNHTDYDILPVINTIIIQNACCKRAFIRGAFLAAGSISDPEKFYHFEIVCTTESKAKQIKEVINHFDIDAKIVIRKKYYVVYIKEGTQIVDMLNIMEAHVALMNLENVRILKEMRNSVNRQVNCETANINKTVSAAVKQVEDINYLEKTIGFHKLSDGLAEVAELRLKHPEASLKELGMLLNPHVGKSGVNHRLRKLSELAEQLRNQKEETL